MRSQVPPSLRRRACRPASIVSLHLCDGIPVAEKKQTNGVGELCATSYVTRCNSLESEINFGERSGADRAMNEKPEAEEFDDEEVDEILEPSDDVDVDRVIRDLDQARRLGDKPKNGDPAWRRLERLREDKLTAELTIDLDDYDIGVEGERPKRKARG